MRNRMDEARSFGELPVPFNTREVAAASRRGINRVRTAAATGALEALPGDPNRRRILFFSEEAVADWIKRGCPEMPDVRGQRPTRKSKTPRRAA